ncbi:hypothetical protein ACFWEU_27900, partial [Streptomyces albidoflavus]
AGGFTERDLLLGREDGPTRAAPAGAPAPRPNPLPAALAKAYRDPAGRNKIRPRSRTERV